MTTPDSLYRASNGRRAEQIYATAAAKEGAKALANAFFAFEYTFALKRLPQFYHRLSGIPSRGTSYGSLACKL